MFESVVMNMQSVCSVLEKGSRVRISAQGAHKSPHLNGMEGVIHAMPVHPTTWFKVQFPSGEIATFRSSALIPLDANGAPIPGFGHENRVTASYYRQESKGTPSGHVGDRDDTDMGTPHGGSSRRVLREHSGHYLNSSADNDMSTGRSSRPRSSSLGPAGRGISTGFRSGFYSNANPRFTSKATEAERKIFNDFVELAYASAYVPDCADNTHGQGVIAYKPLSNEGPCTDCGIRRWRAGTVGGGFCWNQYCVSSPIYGKAKNPRGERPHSVSMSSFSSEAEIARAEGMQVGGDVESTLSSTSAIKVSAHALENASSFYPVSPASSSASLTNVGGMSVDGSQNGAERNGHIVSSSSSTTSSATSSAASSSEMDQEANMQTPMMGGGGGGGGGREAGEEFKTRNDFKGSSGDGGEDGGRSWSFHSADSDGTLTQPFSGLGNGPDSAFSSIKDEGGDDRPIKTREVRHTGVPEHSMSSVVSDQALSELSEQVDPGAGPGPPTYHRDNPSSANKARGITDSAESQSMSVDQEPFQKRPRHSEEPTDKLHGLPSR